MIYKEFNMSDLLVYNKSLCEYFKQFKYVVYRIHDSISNLNYIGITRSMINRLYNKKFGHITNYLNKSSSNDLYKYMNDNGVDNFTLYIEKECNNLLDLSQSEIEFIEKYDSFRNGFNKTKGGFISTVIVSNGLDTITANIRDIPEGYSIIGLPKYDRPDLKDRIIVNNGYNVKRIRESQLDEFLTNGYELGSGGIMDHMSGKVFVYLTNESDRVLISLSNLDKYLSLGYKRGRFTGSSLKGKIRVTNGQDNLVIDSSDKIPEGYRRGVSYSDRRKGNSGRKWINNGVNDKAVLVDELNKFLNTGEWKLGRLISSKLNKISMIKDGHSIFIDKSLKSEYESNGYTKGSSENSGKNKGRIFVTNGVRNKMIYESSLPEYEKLGYYKGIARKPKRKK